MTAIWGEALRRLSSKIAPQNFDMWLRPIECLGIEGRTIILQAPNPYVRLWFESNYLSVILDELRSETDLVYEVEFLPETPDSTQAPDQVDTQTTGQATDRATGQVISQVTDQAAKTLTAEPPAVQAASAPELANEPFVRERLAATDPLLDPSVDQPHRRPIDQPMRQAAHQPARSAAGQGVEPARGRSAGTDPRTASMMPDARPAPEPEIPSAPLNPRYTFDTFVAGPSNQLAYAAAQAAASSYPPKYNPVFICGGVGLGKTHLLHAIGHCFKSHRPDARILYISGERFMNEYIHAIRTNRMHDFRHRYREGCDVLLVDDVQFLAGKDGTQDEFFHTFNALHDSYRQIVLTADRKPHEISDIADRLRTRFAWGLLADIEAPELEVRIAILRQKAAAESIYLPDDVALYIGSSIKSNVRELEGALIRLAAYASLSRRDITLEFARETLEGSLTRPREHVTVEAIIKSVASYYGLKVSDIKSSSRQKAVAGPRAVAMYLARTHTKGSYPDLGRAFGGKHHTTIISAVEKVSTKLESDPGLRGEITAIEGVLLR